MIKSYTEEDVHKVSPPRLTLVWMLMGVTVTQARDLGVDGPRQQTSRPCVPRVGREGTNLSVLLRQCFVCPYSPSWRKTDCSCRGHFAGMAQMLTPVDYATSSTVWASDKWKGVLKVRWIYIKDVPLASLRHIRLSYVLVPPSRERLTMSSNTPENKPVTSSRDTQEVPYDAGCEVLRILSSFQSRTSLLQDFAWYETRTMQGATAPTTTHYQQAQLAQQAFHQQQQAQYHPMQQQHFLPPPLPSSTPPGYQQQHQQQFPMMQGGMMDNGTQQGGRRFYTPPPLPNGPPPPRGNYGGYPGQGY